MLVAFKLEILFTLSMKIVKHIIRCKLELILELCLEQTKIEEGNYTRIRIRWQNYKIFWFDVKEIKSTVIKCDNLCIERFDKWKDKCAFIMKVILNLKSFRQIITKRAQPRIQSNETSFIITLLDIIKVMFISVIELL